MAMTLVSLLVQQELTERSTTDDRVTGVRHISERLFRLEAMVPDPDGELGFVRLTMECQPERLPDMSPSQTVEWARQKLLQMLLAAAGMPTGNR